MAVNHIPVLVRDHSIFVPHPTDVAVVKQPNIGKYQSVGLVSAKLLDDAGKVVDVTAAARAVEPKFLEISVALYQFVEFGSVILIVLGSVFVARLVPVPRRQVHAKFKAIFSRGLLHSVDDVAVPAFPRTALHRVISLPSRPKAEAVVMLGDKHYILDSRRLQSLHPLLRIELRRIEHVRVGAAVAPLLVEKRVGPEMNDGSHFQLLPLNLLRRRFDIRKVLRVAAGGDTRRHNRKSNREEQDEVRRTRSGRHAPNRSTQSRIQPRSGGILKPRTQVRGMWRECGTSPGGTAPLRPKPRVRRNSHPGPDHFSSREVC